MAEKEVLLRHLRFAPSNSVLHPCSLREWFDLALPNGGARGQRIRTLTALPCLIGVVRDSWQQGYFSVHPIRKDWVEMPDQGELLKECPEDKHSVHLSENWSNALEQGLVGSSTNIAEQVGMTSGHVRKIIRLKNLPLEVFDYLKGLDDP